MTSAGRRKWLERLGLVLAIVVPAAVQVAFGHWVVRTWLTDAIGGAYTAVGWERVTSEDLTQHGYPFLLGLYLVFAAVYLVRRKWLYAALTLVLPTVLLWVSIGLIFFVGYMITGGPS